jgi:isoleucyl-tRNA synthetase
LENSDAYSATLAVEPFLDDLTNWYVRRSRRRFWKSEQDSDKQTAYATLYHVLVTLCKLLAPFTPFVTEVMYQNLVRSVQPDAPESVHHCDWPQADLSAIDDSLFDQMALARRIASLGLGARGSANIKVRQPLARALVYVGDAKGELTDELVAIVTDELNVKAFEFVAEEGTLVSYRLLPDNKLLGPKFGPKFPKVRAALAAADAASVASRVRAGLPVTLTVDGESVELAPEEILVQTQPAGGLAVAADKGVTVAVDAVITPALHAEGLAREIVRRVQTMRKDAGFSIDDRITTYYVAESELAEVMVAWGDYIRAETLTTDLVAGQPPADAYTEAHQIEDLSITLGVKQNERMKPASDFSVMVAKPQKA